MEVTRDELELIRIALNYEPHIGLEDRLAAFLVANKDEETFTLIGKKQQGELAFTGFVASGALEMEHRIAELEKHNQQISEHIAGLEVVMKDLLRRN